MAGSLSGELGQNARANLGPPGWWRTGISCLRPLIEFDMPGLFPIGMLSVVRAGERIEQLGHEPSVPRYWRWQQETRNPPEPRATGRSASRCSAHRTAAPSTG